MRLIFTVFLMSLIGGLFAQEAPNFTETDINGTTHTLYDYLDDGKSIIVDFSTTWCGPCWGLHQSKVLSDIHNTLGPDGSDLLRVLFIESDTATTLADLKGETSSSAGDWITGTPYPIIDLKSDTTVKNYNIKGFPTVLGINPKDKSYFDIYEGGISLGKAIDFVLETATLKNNVDLIVSGSSYSSTVCENMEGTLTVYNVSAKEATNTKIEIYLNGNLEKTIDYDQVIPAAAKVEIPIKDVSLSGIDGEIDVLLKAVHENEVVTNNNEYKTSVSKKSAKNVIKIEGTTDQYAAEDLSQIQVLDKDNSVVFDSGILPKSSAYSYDVVIPFEGCSKVVLIDQYGDGFGDEKVKVTDVDNVEIFNSTWDGAKTSVGFTVNEVIVNVQEIDVVESISVSPNPVSEMLNFDVVSNDAVVVDVQVVNSLGVVVKDLNRAPINQGSNAFSIDMKDMPAGHYSLRFVKDGAVSTKRFIKM